MIASAMLDLLYEFLMDTIRALLVEEVRDRVHRQVNHYRSLKGTRRAIHIRIQAQCRVRLFNRLTTVNRPRP